MQYRIAMLPHALEIRHLASFVLACQSPTVGETARVLGVSASTLSEHLHALEQALDLKLFHRQGAYLAPLPAAFWLFQMATAVLHAEAFARSSVTLTTPTAARARIELDLSFNIGRFSKAVSRTVESMRLVCPEVAFEFRFWNSDEDDVPVAARGSDTVVNVGYSIDQREEATVSLFDDPWVIVRRADIHSYHPDTEELVVLRMRKALLRSIETHAGLHGFRDRLSFSDARPADLGDILSSEPTTCFLVPRSLLSERMGLGHPATDLLDPPLATPIVARFAGPERAAASAFIEHLRQELKAPEANAVFRPVLTTRQVRYFNLVHQSGGIAAAARTAHVSQPTVSQQIQRLEGTLDSSLLERTPAGTRLTEAGERLAPLTLELEKRLGRILGETRDVAARTQSAVTLGLLPSSGHDSEMTAQVARALTEVRARFPDCRLRVVQRSNALLHDAVKAGEINLAVVGPALAPFPRVQLGTGERVSVIAHPDLGLAARKSMPLSEVVELPLALGPRQLSIHRAFVDAAETQRLAVNIVLTVESLSLAISMTRLSQLATVVPASSVRQDVDLGRLTATQIDEMRNPGTLSVIFSGERVLSDIERAVVRALAAAFALAPDGG